MREVDSLTPGRNNRTKPSVTFCAIIQKFNGLHSSEAKSKVWTVASNPHSYSKSATEIVREEKENL